MDPVTPRGRAARARIVESAARLMHVNGVAATSVDDVLAAAGAGKSQFYHYFRSKDELVRAVLDFQAALGEEEQSMILTASPGWDGIRRWLDAVVEGQRRTGYSGGCPVGSMAAEMSEREPGLRRRLAEVLSRKQELLAAHLEGLRARGQLREEADPAVLAAFTVATLQGGLLMASVSKDPDVLERSIDEAWGRLVSFRVAS